MNIRDILRKYHIGNNTQDGAVSDVIAWSDARCSARGKLTPELIKEITDQLDIRYDSARNFCDSFPTFTPGYLSNLKKGKKLRSTMKVELLCQILDINIDEFIIAGS